MLLYFYCLCRNGPIAEFKQNPITKSDYQTRLEEGGTGDDEGSLNSSVKSQEVRFWSDYNRVYYHPRSLHALSDLPEWEANKGDWNYGKSAFEKYEAVRLRLHLSLTPSMIKFECSGS